MDRRYFIKGAILTAAGTGLQGHRIFAQSVTTPSSVLAVATGTDYTKLVQDALKALGGINKFVSPGARVVVKPNIGWDRTPEQGANTHPDVVTAIVREALAAGAKEVRVFDRTCNDPRRCYQRSGIHPALDALKDSRVICEHMDERKYVNLPIKNGKSLKEWEFYKDAVEADVYINVPVAKHHGLSGLSLGLKNVMGVIGGNRGKLHHGLGQKLADIATVLKPHLTIIDATRMLQRNGPQGGRISDVTVANKIIAGTDIVAADAYATTLFKKAPEELDSTVAAAALGLGEINLNKIKILEV